MILKVKRIRIIIKIVKIVLNNKTKNKVMRMKKLIKQVNLIIKCFHLNKFNHNKT